jgi:hypothetical protein
VDNPSQALTVAENDASKATEATKAEDSEPKREKVDEVYALALNLISSLCSLSLGGMARCTIPPS